MALRKFYHSVKHSICLRRVGFRQKKLLHTEFEKVPFPRIFTPKNVVKRHDNFLLVGLMKTRKNLLNEEMIRIPGHHRIIAYSTAEEFNLPSLALALKNQDLYIPCELTNDEVLHSGIGNALHTVAKYRITTENRHIYYFQDGTVVIWNCGFIEQQSILNFIRNFEINPYEKEVIILEYEEMMYTYENANKKTFIDNGVMHIATLNKSYEDISSDKYTLSNAMALSVKLGVLENNLSQFVHSVEPVTQELRLGLPVSINQNGILKKTGELVCLRHSINLSTDLLDIPDFYWDRENLEGLYQSTCSYFSITRRTKVLNEKLNHCLELINLVSTHLSDRHHVRLEWMIIILIMVEVAFEAVHYVR